MNILFKDREEAATLLAKKLISYYETKETLILGLPRGGVPIASILSEKLHIPWQIFLVRKLGLPENPEFAIGAMTAEGKCFFNRYTTEQLISSEMLEAIKQKEQNELLRRMIIYNLPLGQFKQAIFNVNSQKAYKTIILVDDGIATGATIKAAILSLKSQLSANIIVATPVIALSTYGEIQAMLKDEESLEENIVSVVMSSDLTSIGSFYNNFFQLTDEDVLEYIRQA